MVSHVVASVIAERNTRRVTWTAAPAKGKSSKASASGKTRERKVAKPKAASGKVKEGDVCPLCGKGTVIRGKTSRGCSRWKEGCDFRAPLK